MAAMTTHFPSQKAPCGRATAGDHHIESDDDGLSFEDVRFSCGCRETPAHLPRRLRARADRPTRRQSSARRDRNRRNGELAQSQPGFFTKYCV